MVLVLLGALSSIAPACKPRPGSRCQKGTAVCQDPHTELACQAGRFLAAPCRGPAGCSQKGDVIECDVSLNVAGSTDDEGNGACSDSRCPGRCVVEDESIRCAL